MANYLVTGAAGFIAFRVVEMLLRQGHTVVGVDNLNDAYDVRMKEYRLRRLQSLTGFSFHKLDVSNRTILEPSTFGLRKFSFDAVINLAARAGVRASTEDPWVFIDTNVTGTLNLLELCRHHGIKKFVTASSSSVYGADPPYPTPEEAESDRPLQPYAASKKGAEALCYSYHHLFDIDVSILRYFTVYGPAGRPDLAIFRFVQWISEGRPVQINGDGEQSRGFTYLDDIARGTILALKPLGFEIINLGGHEVITIKYLVKLIEEIIGKQARVEYGPAHPADMRSNWADISKAGRLLGWEPQVDLRQGLQELIDWYNTERSWASEVLTP
jgi:UDP-glucuronate 4-epimerase